MKTILPLFVALALLIGQFPAEAKSTKQPKKNTGSSEVQGGGYYDGKYHGYKKGEAKKPLLRWDGFDDPIKGMKEAQKKPPTKTPSQSTDK